MITAHGITAQNIFLRKNNKAGNHFVSGFPEPFNSLVQQDLQ
jgi:hypothetical protein